MERYLKRFLQQSLEIDGADPSLIKNDYLAWDYLQDVSELTPEAIIAAHAYIIGVKPEDHDFRDEPSYYGSFVFSDPYHMIHAKAKAFCAYANVPPSKRLSDESRIKIAFYQHLVLGKIRPFQEGNGRLIRLIALWAMEKYQTPPMLFKGDSRKDYFDMFISYNNEEADKVGIRLEPLMEMA